MGSKKQTTKGTSTSQQQQTQTATPWAPAQPGLANLAQLTNQAMLQAQAVPKYTGDFVALPGQLQQAVIPALQAAGAQAGALIPQVQGTINDRLWTQPSFAGSPSLAAGTQTFGSYDASQVAPVVQAAIAPYLRQLTEQILPSIQSAGIESGAYSSDRALGVAPQTALRDTSRMASEVAAGIAFQDFLANQQRQQQAYQMSTQRGLGEADVLSSRLGMYPELIDTVMRLSTGQADIATQAAAYDAAMRQAAINNSLAQDTYNVQAPYRGLDMAANIFNTFQPYGTRDMTGTSAEQFKQTTTTKEPLAGQILQGAIGVGSMLAGFPGMGTALGLGGLAGSAANPMLSMAMPSLSSAFSSPINPFQFLPTGFGGG